MAVSLLLSFSVAVLPASVVRALSEIGWFGLTGLAWRQRLGETESLSAISVVPQRL
jgi:hypothetical protein